VLFEAPIHDRSPPLRLCDVDYTVLQDDFHVFQFACPGHKPNKKLLSVLFKKIKSNYLHYLQFYNIQIPYPYTMGTTAYSKHMIYINSCHVFCQTELVIKAHVLLAVSNFNPSNVIPFDTVRAH